MPVRHKLIWISAIMASIALGSCSNSITEKPTYAAHVVSRDDLLSGVALLGAKAKNIQLPDDHVLELNDKMRHYLDRYIPNNNMDSVKVKTLARMIFGPGLLGMKYDARQTYTAQDAFLKLEGNCLAFSYLFAAMAREKGLKVSFQEVQIPPEWSETDNELLYYSRHVNIRVHLRESRDFIVDIDQVNNKSHYRSWKISDNNAIALYYSNRGTDYLQDGDMKNAFRYLVKGLEMAPGEAAIWSNLGVLYRMNEMYVYAEKAYFIALKYDRRNQSALGNLSVLYEHMGEVEKSDYYFKLAQDHQMRNPYFRYYQALDAYELEDYSLALNHLKAALKRQDQEPKFHDLMGDTYARLGDDVRADKARTKAQKLSGSESR